MNREIKRLLGLAIVLVMALAVMTVSAFAAEETNVAKIGDTEYATLANAISAADAGNTITLLNNVNENVTISKKLTIDGAGNQYTGKMTISNNKNVIVQDVEFVKGYINEEAGAHGYLTVKDCSFDGVDKSIGYAITHRGGDALVIENTTAKNYSTGMLYVPSAVTTITVADVEVSNVVAAFNISYSGDATFENVKFNNVTYGIHFQIYGSRTYTVKNSDLSGATNPFWFWDKSSNTHKVTVLFEGENTVPVFQNPIPAGALKLAEGAALTAPEGLEVTTDVADHKVVYADGAYSLVDVGLVKIGDTKYASLAEAITAAKAGDTITFLADVNENVTINKNLTIDGAGNDYTGTMTANKGLTVTVQNVNFVNGGFAKTAKSTTGNYTFDGCTFDGEGKYYYPLRFVGANKITVENSTVKDYMYSFLYVTSSTNTVSVKNVTVEDCPSYAVYFASGVTKATFENLTVKNSNNGFVINNTANRAFTINNCKMENVNTAINHANGTNSITCTVNGVNDFGGAAFSQYVKVIADAQIGTKIYDSLMTAFADAKDGDIITLISDVALANSDFELSDYNMYAFVTLRDKKVTLDLNGYTITANPSLEGTMLAVFCVTDTADLTLTDTSEAQTGAVNVTMAEGTMAYSMLMADGEKSKLTINGGNYYIDKIEAGYSMIYIAQTGTGYVNGGNFVLGNAYSFQKEDAMVPWIFNTYANGKNFVQVKGGTYNVNPQNRWNEVKFPKGYVAYEDLDGVWKVARGPIIVKQPADVTIGYNKMAKIAPVIAGDGLTYKWYYKDTNSRWYTSTLTTATYDIKGLVSRDGRQVYCVATDCTGKSVTTEIATLSVVPNEELAIVSQPTVVEGALNKKVSVALDVTGDDLTYVWYYSDNGGKSYYKSSLTAETYDIILKEERMGRKVYCIITDAFGKSVKSEVITINAVQTVELKLLSAPAYEAVAVGETAKITLDIQGEGLKYTWYYSLPGKTTFYKSSITDSEYKLTLSEDRVGRNVYCVITDAFGNSITTEKVTLVAE